MKEISTENQIKTAQEIREQFRDIMKKIEQVREEAALISCLKEPLSRGTQDMGEMIIDMIYLICDFIGSKNEEGK